MSYSCDFETLTKVPTRVWLWAFCDIEDYKNVLIGTNIKEFINEISRDKYNKKTFYIHNLKFDVYFIIYELLVNMNFKHTTEKLEPYSFKTLISGMGQWYQMKIMFKNTTITLKDSFKKLPFSVKNIAKAFKLTMTKGDTPLYDDLPIDYTPSEKDIDYIKRDVGIVAQALKILFEQGLNKLTIGADAMNSYKTMTGKFRDIFPLLTDEVDNFCRKAYKGGYVYCNPKYKGKDIDEMGSVYDVNSMYPWAMKYKPMPYGIPIYYVGEYINDKEYPLYIQHFYADFKLKKHCLPTVQLKNNRFFLERDYIIDSNGLQECYMTSVDYDLFIKNYNIYEIQFIDGYKFMSIKGAFNIYINYWLEIKENNEGAMRTLAKLMLNSLYGKFAKNADVTGKEPYLDEDNIVRLRKGKEEISETNYIPVGCFITAWSRHNLINTILQCYDRFIYCDTDSIHIKGIKKPNIPIHKSKLGYWKLEALFVQARYIHAKCYYEEMLDFTTKVTVSGLPYNCHKQVTWENFHIGTEYTGKLIQKSVIGGAILTETSFIIGD